MPACLPTCTSLHGGGDGDGDGDGTGIGTGRERERGRGRDGDGTGMGTGTGAARGHRIAGGRASDRAAPWFVRVLARGRRVWLDVSREFSLLGWEIMLSTGGSVLCDLCCKPSLGLKIALYWSSPSLLRSLVNSRSVTTFSASNGPDMLLVSHLKNISGAAVCELSIR